ncbi:MAG: PEGA domain-containing protein [Myxococcaceae bacterium]|nr:PEGA domain-containing protein [Myxococcaceae bacterium]
MASRALVVVLVWAGVAHAGPKAISIAAGDCRDPELLNGATAFSDAVSGLLRTDALDPAAVLDQLRPRPSAGPDDVQRQLDAAQSQFYANQFDKALDGVHGAMKALERLPPSDAVAKQQQAAGVLEGLIFKSLSRKTEQLDAWRKVVRTAPDYKLDPDFHSPATIQQFEGLKKDVAKAKRVPLNVTSTPSGAAVFVDGVRAGVTPLSSPGFAAGTYRVVVTQGEKQSFAYEVKLDAKPVDLQIDLGFEGTLRPQLPLCVNTTTVSDSEALKLATRAGADRALVLRVDSTGWVTALLFEVAKGARVREGGMKMADARKNNGYSDLASFVLTGQPAKLALSGSRPDAPVADPARTEPVAPAPEPVATTATSSSSSGGVPRAVPIAIAAAGVIVAVAGVAVFASGGNDRAALAAAIDERGQVRDPTDTENATFLGQRITTNTTISAALMAGGGVLAVTGAILFFVLGPKDAPQPTVMLTPNGGAYAGVTGSF